jgi:hypothetical protein
VKSSAVSVLHRLIAAGPVQYAVRRSQQYFPAVVWVSQNIHNHSLRRNGIILLGGKRPSHRKPNRVMCATLRSERIDVARTRSDGSPDDHFWSNGKPLGSVDYPQSLFTSLG